MSPFFNKASAIAFWALAQISAARPHHVSRQTPAAFETSYLFTAEVNLAPPPKEINTNPITIPGGVVVPEAIPGGTVSGPFLNGTIVSGLATPAVYGKGNETVQAPTITLYGVTNDGFPFTLHETGIGSPQAQMTRIEIDIGGGDRYSNLRNGFILATVNPNAERTIVHVQTYLVQNTVGSDGS